MLSACLDDLEARLDAAVEEDLADPWRRFALGCFSGTVFAPRRCQAAPPGRPWPAYQVNPALEDFDAMAMQQYGLVSDMLAQGNGYLPSVRANYGTAILPSLFGAELFVMDERLNTLPTCWPLRGGLEAIKATLDRGIPDLHEGLGARTLEMGRRFMDIGRRYPRIGRHVHIYHPDLQGPMDVCELLWGSNLFLDVYDVPELVHQMLDLIVRTYIAFMRQWQAVVPPPPAGEPAVHWGMMHQGRIMLRNDSAMNFSPAMYEHFIRPYDQRLFDELGGGAIHFCGRGDHYVPAMAGMNQLYAINLSQPHLNNMETIFRHTLDQGLMILGYPAEHVAAATQRPLHGRLHRAG